MLSRNQPKYGITERKKHYYKTVYYLNKPLEIKSEDPCIFSVFIIIKKAPGEIPELLLYLNFVQVKIVLSRSQPEVWNY